MKVLKKLSNKPFCNELHFFVIAIILLLISFRHVLFLVILVAYLIFLYRKTSLILPVVLTLLFLSLSYLFYNHRYQVQENQTIEDTYEIIEEHKNYYIFKAKTKYVVYKNNHSFQCGDIVQAKLKLYGIDSASYSGDFDAKSYYLSLGITGRGSIIEIQKIDHRITKGSIKQNILSFYETRLEEVSFQYVKSLLFGKDDFDANIKDAYSKLLISHFLVISGMHMIIIFTFFRKVIQFLFHKEGSYFSLGILFCYLSFLNYPVSASRAFLMLFLSIINKKGSIQYTRLDIFSLAFLFLSISNPLQSYQNSFILTFVVSFAFLFLDELMPTKNPFFKGILSSLIATLFIFPFIINQTNTLSLMSLFLAGVLSIFLSKVIFPMVFILLVIPIPLLNSFLVFINHTFLFLSNHMSNIAFPNFSFGAICLYYILLYLGLVGYLKRRTWLCFIFVGYIFLFSVCKFVLPYAIITFIDVGQGDSVLVELPFNKGVVLIDCYYGSVDFVLSRGIKTVDYLILTHFDEDHIADSSNAFENLDIKKILYSKYENLNDFAYPPTIRPIAVSTSFYFTLHSVKFNILGPIYDHEERNSNSIVLNFSVFGKKFLCTGDMTIEEEKDLIKLHKKILESDVLKVGHHGSKTSSSLEFLNYVRPQYSIISVGKYNQYQLPNLEVVERLKQYGLVYQTSISGNISFIVGKNLFRIETFR